MLDHGLRCRNSSDLDPNYRDIGNPDLIEKRDRRIVPIPPGGTLSDYIPFYFTPCSPMLFNIKTGYNGMKRTPMTEVVILVGALPTLAKEKLPFVFTDRHAYLQTASFFSSLDALTNIDWKILRVRDFRRADSDPGKFERYQAEALIHGSLPFPLLSGIACYGSDQAAFLSAEAQSRGLSTRIVIRPSWYP